MPSSSALDARSQQLQQSCTSCVYPHDHPARAGMGELCILEAHLDLCWRRVVHPDQDLAPLQRGDLGYSHRADRWDGCPVHQRARRLGGVGGVGAGAVGACRVLCPPSRNTQHVIACMVRAKARSSVAGLVRYAMLLSKAEESPKSPLCTHWGVPYCAILLGSLKNSRHPQKVGMQYLESSYCRRMGAQNETV